MSISISAVVPSYNNAPYLPAAIGSIRSQVPAVSEIIVVDDGSTDDTARVIAQLGDGIRYLRQDNSGPSAARNRGLAQARGDWIAFLDADDQWTQDKLEKQLKALQRHPELGLIAGDMAEIDLSGTIITPSVLAKHHLQERFQALDGAPAENPVASLLEKNFIPTGTVLARRALLMEAGGFPEDIRFGEDLALWVRVAAKAPITCLADRLMLRLQHGANLTGSNERMVNDLVRVARYLRETEPEGLRSAGIDPDRLVSQSLGNLGYWLFDQGRSTEARRALRESFRELANTRAAAYWLASCLPSPVINTLRHLKSG
ncbi:MAG: glycosyltransferase family 2 protein [Chromatiales bacterium]|nr:glycosyltransferase family 2 protein [Chromatiales bacterium]